MLSEALCITGAPVMQLAVDPSNELNRNAPVCGSPSSSFRSSSATSGDGILPPVLIFSAGAGAANVAVYVVEYELQIAAERISRCVRSARDRSQAVIISD